MGENKNHMRMARLRKLYTQKELAEESGVSERTIQGWEQGTSCAHLSAVVAVCDVLGISIDEYIGRKVDA